MAECPPGHECVSICSDRIELEIGFGFDAIADKPALVDVERSREFKSAVIAELDLIRIAAVEPRGDAAEAIPSEFFSAQALALDGFEDEGQWKSALGDDETYEEELERVRAAVRRRMSCEAYPKIDIDPNPVVLACCYDSEHKCWRKCRTFRIEEEVGAPWTLSRALDRFKSSVSGHPTLGPVVAALTATDEHRLRTLPLIVTASWHMRISQSPS